MTINEAKSIIKQHGLYVLKEQATGSFEDYVAKLNDLWAETYKDDENYQSIDELMQDEWYADIINSYYEDGIEPTKAVDKLVDAIYEESQNLDNENDYIGDEEQEDEENYEDYPEDENLGKLNGFEEPEDDGRIPDDYSDEETDLYDDMNNEYYPSDEEIREAVEVLGHHGFMLNEANEFRGMDPAAFARCNAFKNCYASAKSNHVLERDPDKVKKFIYGFASFIPDAPERGKAKLRSFINSLNQILTDTHHQDAITVAADGKINGAVPPQPTGRGGDNPNPRGHRLGGQPAQQAQPAHEEPAAPAAPARQERPAAEAPAEVNVRVTTRTVAVEIDTEGGEETANIREAYESLKAAVDDYDPEGNKIALTSNFDGDTAKIYVQYICNNADGLSQWVKDQIDEKFDNVFTFVEIRPNDPEEKEIAVRQGHGLIDNEKPGPLPAEYQELFADIPAAGEEEAPAEEPAEEAPAREEAPAEEAPAEEPAGERPRNREPRRINGPVHRMARPKEWRVYYHPVDENGNVNPAITDNVVVAAPTKEAALEKLNDTEDPIVFDYKPGDFNERRPNEGGSFIEIWEEI